MKKFCLFLISSFMILLMLSFEIFACACCAERGHYTIHTSEPSKYILEIIKQLKFSSVNLYTDAAYPQNIKGIKPLNEEFSTISNEFDDDEWKFLINDADGNSGMISAEKPVSMVSYMVDLEPNGKKTDMIQLYKELRFKYKVTKATGIFSSGTDTETEYLLVLQGKGNVCTNPSDFYAYRLEVSGEKAQYSFFGKVTSDSDENEIASNGNGKFVIGKRGRRLFAAVAALFKPTRRHAKRENGKRGAFIRILKKAPEHT